MAINDDPEFQEMLKNTGAVPAAGGGYIAIHPEADLLAPITKCECKWGLNDCPNEVHTIVVCNKVRGFTVCCEPHVLNFSANVDPFDGSYTYMKPEQFEAAKAHGLYSKYDTFKAFVAGVKDVIISFEQAVEFGVFPRG